MVPKQDTNICKLRSYKGYYICKSVPTKGIIFVKCGSTNSNGIETKC